MKRCYTRFYIKTNQANIKEYDINFKINHRNLRTGKFQLPLNGKSIDIYAALTSRESIKDCNAFVTFYLPGGIKFNNSPFLLRISDKSIIEHSKEDKDNPIKLYTIFDIKVTKANTESNPNNKKTQGITNIFRHDIPYGLRWVSYLRKQIKYSASKNNVDVMAIASIIFQEKYHGIWAARKNGLSSLNGMILDRHSSYGYGEMQLGLAADLLGLNEKVNPNYLEETFTIISTDAEIALDLIGKNINNEQLKRKRQLTVFEATVFHNAGTKGLQSYIDNQIPNHKIIKSVYGRSWKWQNAIKMALDGILTSQPDGCEREICNSYIEQDLSEWQFDGSLKIQF